MGSLLHIVSQLNPERSYLHPQAVFRLIERGEPVPLGEDGERKWAVPQAITMIEEVERGDGHLPRSFDPGHFTLSGQR
ncbi:MAG TPA: hypothetical protein VJ741_01695 [Solirubrobacteraceae bacterium]|jgi:hypothetical protein|nr:hypothetical protein [Solirubrobacteraceae bacterium]